MLDALRARLRALVRRNRIESEIDAELRFHVEMATQANRAAGMTPEEARRVALRDLGGVTQTKEAVRDVRGAWLDSLRQDLRLALRNAWANPGFSATVVATLVMGIGVNAGVFTIVSAVLLHRLPYPEPERIVRIQGSSGQSFVRFGPFGFDLARPEFKASRAFSALGVYSSGGVTLGGDQPERLRATAATPGFFAALGARPVLGRTVSDQDVREQADVVVISQALWRRRFASDPSIVGHPVSVNGRPFTVVGVMPARVEFPGATEVWLPPTADSDLGNSVPPTALLARLAPGITAAQARDEVLRVHELAWPQPRGAGVAALPGPQAPPRMPAEEVVAVTLRDALVGGVRPVLVLLAVAALLALLVASVNAANLLLARLASREREFAVRRALGASSGRLARQVFVESLVLAALAGVAAAPAAALTLAVARLFLPPTLPGAADVAASGHMLAVLAALSLFTGALLGLPPALSARLRPGVDLLRGVSGGAATDRAWRRVRATLVAGQLTAALVLLAGAVTVTRTVTTLASVDLGAREDRAVTIGLHLPWPGYSSSSDVPRFYERLEREVRTIPGVEEFGMTDQLPGDVDEMLLGEPITVDRMPPTAQVRRFAGRFHATPRYFAALGIDLVAGRGFNRADGPDADPVVVVSEGYARALGLEPPDVLGRRHGYGSRRRPSGAEIVGVVRDVRLRGPESEPAPAVYYPFAQDPPRSGSVHLVLTSTRTPADLLPLIRAALVRVDRNLAPAKVRAFQEIRLEYLAGRRLAMTLMLVFGGLAAVLALLGLYGVVVYLVQMRTQEMGVRLALGATPWRVQRHIVAGGLLTAGAGVLLGAFCAVELSRVVMSAVPGAGPADPSSLLVLGAALVAASTAATWMAAGRVTRIDPATTLRSE